LWRSARRRSRIDNIQTKSDVEAERAFAADGMTTFSDIAGVPEILRVVFSRD